MKSRIDMDKIAKGLNAERRGKVRARGGYFGARQLAAEIESTFRVPATGGRATNPSWTERRLVPLAPKTLQHLEELAARISKHTSRSVEPLQLAARMLEKTAQDLTEKDAEKLLSGARNRR